MKALAFASIIAIFLAAAHAQQPTVPALKPAEPINMEPEPATPTPTSASADVNAAPPTAATPVVTRVPIAPTTPAPATPKAVRKVHRVRFTPNDAINGFKYPPARVAAEKSARWANSAHATVSSGANGRVTFVYGESVPKIACAYLRVCSVELEAGETVNKVDAGDPVRWSITPSIVGEGANRTVYVIIKPKSDEPGLFTNVKIATNRRMYDLDIFSVRGEQFVRQINFSYPENEQREWEAQRLAMAKEDALVTAQPALSVDKLNFNYSIEGEYSHRPVRVFDDGDKTYVQMGLDFRTQEAPVLVLIGPDDKEQLVNYRLKNGYYIIDKIFTKAALIVGVGDDQQKVVITRGCAKQTIFGGCAAG